MKQIIRHIGAALLLLALLAQVAAAANWTTDMKEGKLTLKSAGPLAFGPDGILFVADTKAAAIVAIATGDSTASAAKEMLQVKGINEKIAALLGTTADQILINDLAVNPLSHKAYLAISRGRGPDAIPVLIRVNTDGHAEFVGLEKVKYSCAELPDAPVEGVVGQGNRQSNPRQESITDIAFFEDRLLVAGLSNEEFASTFRAIPFPFSQANKGAGIEIYHGSHGRFETNAPVRTFVPYEINKESFILAAYTCTPLVKIAVNDLKPGAKVKGMTIAELGNRNRPLDMIAYHKDGHEYILMANQSRGVMKLKADALDRYQAITAHTEAAGVPYETIADLKGVQQLDKLDDANAVILTDASGSLDLRTIALP